VPSNATSSCQNITSEENTGTSAVSGTASSTSTSPAHTGAAIKDVSLGVVPVAVAGLVALVGAALVL
jgi:hypothetical protein